METFWKQKKQNNDYLETNTQYLVKIKNYYYFSFRYKKKIIKYSLNCCNLYDANIIKIQLIKRLKMNEELKNFFKNPTRSDLGVNTYSHKDEDPEKVAELNKKILNLVNQAYEDGDIKSVEFNSDNVKKIKLEEAFKNFLNHKEIVDDLRKSSLKKYLTHYRYLLLFCDEDKLIYSFTEQFFKDIQNKIRKLPVNVLKTNKYKNSKYDVIMKDFKDTKYSTLSNKSINEIFKSFNQVFDFFNYENYITSNCVEYRTLKEDTEHWQNFEDNEIQLFIEKTEDKLYKDIFKIGLYTGMRIGEISELKTEFVDIEKGIIDVSYSKTKAGIRIIPIHKNIKKILEFYCANNIDGYLFVKDGNKNILTKGIGRRIRKLIPDTDKVFHSTRKNLTIKLYELHQKGEVQENTIKKILGHDFSDNLSFNVYNLNKINIEILRDCIDRIDYKLEDNVFKNIDTDIFLSF